MCLVKTDNLIGVMGLLILGDYKRISAGCLKIGKLLSSDLEKLTNVFLRGIL